MADSERDLLQKLAVELTKQMEYRFFDSVKTTFSTAPRANNDIETDGQLASTKPKSFTHPTLPSISNRSRSDTFGNGESNPGVIQFVANSVNHQNTVGRDGSLFEDTLKIGS